MIYNMKVPKSIFIGGENNATGSARIINYNGQALFKVKDIYGYSVSNQLSRNDNNNLGYELVPTEIIKPNNLYYYVDEANDFSELENIERYVVNLSSDHFAHWIESGEYYEIEVLKDEYKEVFFYEVVKLSRIEGG